MNPAELCIQWGSSEYQVSISDWLFVRPRVVCLVHGRDQRGDIGFEDAEGLCGMSQVTFFAHAFEFASIVAEAGNPEISQGSF
jgi:hypothetical protein